MFGWISDSLVEIGRAIINIFPDSPIQTALQEIETNETIQQWLRYVNWFIPVHTMLTIFNIWLSAVLIYYVYQIVLRWVKVIE